MTLAMLSPPALGTATVDSATGVVNYLPPYMKDPKDIDGVGTSLVLQASDPSGLKSPPLNVSISFVSEPTPGLAIAVAGSESCFSFLVRRAWYAPGNVASMSRHR
jgi:hypothetical protein